MSRFLRLERIEHVLHERRMAAADEFLLSFSRDERRALLDGSASRELMRRYLAGHELLPFSPADMAEILTEARKRNE